MQGFLIYLLVEQFEGINSSTSNDIVDVLNMKLVFQASRELITESWSCNDLGGRHVYTAVRTNYFQLHTDAEVYQQR